MPINVMIIRALLNYYMYYGDNFKIECPTGSGKMMNLFEVSKELADRLVSTFTVNEAGERPVFGGAEKFQNDPNWRDNILFYEYFHGDNGAGLGASHQTGWTELCQSHPAYGSIDPQKALEGGKKSVLFQLQNQSLNKMKKPKYPSLYQINTRFGSQQYQKGLAGERH
jgi:hypothetical protein